MTWGADLTAPARQFLDRHVWVDLDRLYGPPPEDTRPRREGLALTGKVPGMLKSWIRALDGRWVGIVDFSISDSHGGHVTRATGVPIPAEALTELVMPPRR
jgi:hypothetical protein